MSQARGTQTSVAIADEDTYGQDAGTPDAVRAYYTSEGVKGDENQIQDDTLTSDRSRKRPGKGNINVSGALTSNMGAEWIGKLLKHLLGSVSTTGADPYSHVITIGDLPVSFTYEKDYGANITNRYEKFNGCRVGSCEFSFPQEGWQTAAFQILGASRALGNSPLDATVTDPGHTAFSGRQQATIQEGGSDIAYVQDLKFSIDNGLDQNTYALGGNGVRRAADEGFASISGTLTALFESDALLTKAVNDTETSIQITLSRGDGLGSAGNESIDFQLNQLTFAQTSPEIGGPAGLLVPLAFNGYANAAGSDLGLQITLKNAVATL